MPENKVQLRYYLFKITPTAVVSEGRLCLEGIPQWIGNKVKYFFGSFTSYSEGRLILTRFPEWFDPTEEIAPDVTELPPIESITTEEGKATITYLWP